MDNISVPAQPTPEKKKGGSTGLRIAVIAIIGALLAVGVYASPRFFGNEEKEENRTHLKTGGTSVGSVILENRWKAEYRKKKGVQVDYESTGSTAGVEKMLQKEFVIAFSHAPMSSEQQSKAKSAGGDVIHTPVVLCSVVPAYNVKELKGKKPINFTGEVLGDIFLGKIKTWNDPALKAINKDLELPATPITVVHRDDSSGTTLIFTDYLSKASSAWHEKFPRGESVIKWPVGEGATRNLNVGIKISEIDGAIGYIDLLYTNFNELQLEFGAVQNKDKSAFLQATTETMTEAAKGALPEVPEDLTFDLTYKAGPKSYPITGVIYAICFKSQPEPTYAHVVDFLNWATHDGQQFAEKMSYAPLPAELVSKIDQRLKLVSKTP